MTQNGPISWSPGPCRNFPTSPTGWGLPPQPPKVNPHRLNYMAPLEPFFVQMKIAMITGLALAFPLILYQMWLFFAPALYPKEKKIIYYFLPVGTVAFILGDYFFLKMVWPLIISFSLRYESEFLFSMLNLTQFVNFCLRLLLLFGLIFELPLILLILARVGIVRVDFLCRQRRVAILLSVVVAAFHADVLTMAAIAIPLYGMYELSIVTVRLFGGPYSRGEDLGAGPGAGGNRAWDRRPRHNPRVVRPIRPGDWMPLSLICLPQTAPRNSCRSRRRQGGPMRLTSVI